MGIITKTIEIINKINKAKDQATDPALIARYDKLLADLHARLERLDVQIEELAKRERSRRPSRYDE